MSRAIVVVAAGSGSRFSGDKTMVPVRERPLVAVTASRLLPLVDELVLVCRPEQRNALSPLGLTMVAGGDTRTASEIAGLRALRPDHELIGIHDGARPNVFPELVERLFEAAARVGGAVPVVDPDGPVIDRRDLRPLPGVVAAQTPQVFRGPDLLEAYRSAAEDGFGGQDTADVVQRYSTLQVAAVEGDPRNVKVTYPGDLEMVIPDSAGP